MSPDQQLPTPVSHCLQYQESPALVDRWITRRGVRVHERYCKESGRGAIRSGGSYDHVHLLVHIPAKLSVSDIVGTLKSNSSKHTNDTSEQLRKFGWQDGFGAFTVSVSQKNRVVGYIENQMVHHTDHSFQDEYLHLLKKYEVEYDPRYVWD